MSRTRVSIVAISLVACAPSFVNAAEIPTEFESPQSILDRLFSFFGGVRTFALTPSTNLLFSGDSLQIDVEFQPSFFSAAGIGIGTAGITPPALHVAPNADTFSITVQSPTTGDLSFVVTIQEDDSGDGIIDLGLGDDEWESPLLVLQPGTNVYNIPTSTFIDTGLGSGNGIMNFTTTTAMGLIITFESNTNLPSGIITTPTTFFIDHAGLYAGNQVIPPLVCLGDADGSGAIDFSDITSVLGNWQANYTALPSGTGPGDADGDGLVNFTDITTVLGHWQVICP